jgi:hypothetical protein
VAGGEWSSFELPGVGEPAMTGPRTS